MKTILSILLAGVAGLLPVFEQGDGKLVLAPEQNQKSSISAFLQYGVNNSDVLPVNQSFGEGLTAFGFAPHRPADSMGVGMSCAWLNSNIFDRSSELMFQT